MSESPVEALSKPSVAASELRALDHALVRGRVVAALRRRRVPCDAREDTVQEVMVALLERAARLAPLGIDDVVRYATRIAVGVLADEGRARRRASALTEVWGTRGGRGGGRIVPDSCAPLARCDAACGAGDRARSR